MRQHYLWKRQPYAWPDTCNGGGRHVKLLVQLQPDHQQQLRGPEDIVHGNSLLDNRNTLHPKHFKVRRLRSSSIDIGGRNNPPNSPFFLKYHITVLAVLVIVTRIRHLLVL